MRKKCAERKICKGQVGEKVDGEIFQSKEKRPQEI